MCYKCNQPGHTVKDCPRKEDYPVTPCPRCGIGKHWAAKCDNPRDRTSVLFSTVANVNMLTHLDRELTIAALCVRATTMHKRVGVVFGKHMTSLTFTDTGAGFSCISAETVERWGLSHLIEAPIGSKRLYYAAKHLSTKRVGKIALDLTLHFPDSRKRSMKVTMCFEVLNIPWDFLFGVDAIPAIFGSSMLLDYGAEKASIAREPMNVQHIGRDESVIAKLQQEDAMTMGPALALLVADSHYDLPRVLPRVARRSRLSAIADVAAVAPRQSL